VSQPLAERPRHIATQFSGPQTRCDTQ
jgi:hypothetical protein